ncbi:MAG: HDOD domain-containing protein [Gammaproteobacteria bacterium]|nr:HDOD domain-containing protein [Gammaproteobacteria bacterium]
MTTDCTHILKEINHHISEFGDLPIFSSTVNRIRTIGSNPDSSAVELANEVTKDVNMTTKLLRLANSIHYNRGTGKISLISRGIVLLGFNTIMNMALTLKLIESFQLDNPNVDMDKLLVRAYLTAGFARELALAAGVKDIEETYTCALLHNLGEIISAYAFSNKYMEMNAEKQINGTDGDLIEKKYLGGSLSDIGKCIAENWGFPANIVKSLQTTAPNKLGYTRNPAELNSMISTLSSKAVEALQTGEANYGGMNFREMLGTISKVLGVEFSKVDNCLVSSFKMSCDLASECGLKTKKLMPNTDISGDGIRDRLALKLAYLAGNTQIKIDQLENNDESNLADDAETALSEDPLSLPNAVPANALATDAAANHGVDSNAQLQYIQEITAMLAQRAGLHAIFDKVLLAIHNSAGFDHAVLMLVNTNHTAYAARLAHGKNPELFLKYFNFPLAPDTDLFSKIILNGSELLVDNPADPSWAKYLPADFRTKIGNPAFILAAMRTGQKPLGLIFAGRSPAITPINYRGFMQFVAQARLAIQISR